MKVEIKNVSKSFKSKGLVIDKKDERVKVIDDINVTFNPGKIYGLVGRNGSGKTVLLKIICGILKPDTGTILFDGEETIKINGIPKSTRALIETPDMIDDLSGFENLKLIASIQNTITDDDIYKVLELVGLKGEENKKYRAYSLGMKQKLGIAQVIMEDADLLIFDEPFNGLDDASANKMRDLFRELKKKNKIIIVATHIKEDVENLIDELYKVDAGVITYEN